MPLARHGAPEDEAKCGAVADVGRSRVRESSELSSFVDMHRGQNTHSAVLRVTHSGLAPGSLCAERGARHQKF